MQSYRVERSTAAGVIYAPISIDNSIVENELLKMEVTGRDGSQAKSDGGMARFTTNGVIFKMDGKLETFEQHK